MNDEPMDDGDSKMTVLKLELTRLSEACARLKSHPALGQAANLASLGVDHADLMMNYADQLDDLFRAITVHADTLRRLADQDVEAAALSLAVQRTIADLDRTIPPVITSLRRHAWSLGAGQQDSRPGTRPGNEIRLTNQSATAGQETKPQRKLH
jgi:hypothetical protein